MWKEMKIDKNRETRKETPKIQNSLSTQRASRAIKSQSSCRMKSTDWDYIWRRRWLQTNKTLNHFHSKAKQLGKLLPQQSWVLNIFFEHLPHSKRWIPLLLDPWFFLPLNFLLFFHSHLQKLSEWLKICIIISLLLFRSPILTHWATSHTLSSTEWTAKRAQISWWSASTIKQDEKTRKTLKWEGEKKHSGNITSFIT